MRIVRLLPVAAAVLVAFASCEPIPGRDEEPILHLTTAVDVALPARAHDRFRLRDQRSGLYVDIRVDGATSVRGATRGDALRYPHAVGGNDLVVRRLPTGFEDAIELRRDGVRNIGYVLDLDGQTAGLRLVDGSLELLDRGGVPRLRMAKPFAWDRRGHRIALDVSVSGCAVDTAPAPPFDRAPINPGARRCFVRTSWGALELPAIVDPAWTSTASLATPRYRHVAALLPDGKVLVAGGFVPDPITVDVETKTAEVYAPTQGVFTNVGSMNSARAIAAAAALPSGDILVTGGLDGVGAVVLASAEIYRAATGTWSPTGSLATPRAGHTATPVGDGTILVAAGYDNTGDHFNNAELFTGPTFTPAGDINTSRFFHSAVAIGSGRVLLAAGTEPFTGALGTLELYTAGVGWSSAASLTPMTTARTLHTAAVLPDGDVLVAGGYASGLGELATAERYRPSTNTWSPVASKMSRARYDTVGVTLTSGDVLFVGGQILGTQYRDAERFAPTTSTFDRFTGQTDERAFGHTVTALLDGRALAIGGYDPSRILASCDLFDPALATVDAGDDLPDAANDGALDGAPDAAAPDSSPADAAIFVDATDSLPPGSGIDAANSPPAISTSYTATGGCRVSSGRTGLEHVAVGIVLLLLRRRRVTATSGVSRSMPHFDPCTRG